MGAHLAEVAAADGAGSDDDTLGIHGNLTACRAAANPGGAAVGDFDGADVRVEQHLQVRPVRMRLERVQQPVHDLISRAPGDVPPWNGVARTINATFGPVDQRQERNLLMPQELKDVLNRILAVEPAHSRGQRSFAS
jgi:hypothetical protein